jgi:hypothetical protein
MPKGDRANLERLLRKAWENQCRIQAASATTNPSVSNSTPMPRETKFGYGFLLVGIGMPYLIDRVVGLFWAILISVSCVVIGGVFLWFGHRQKENRPHRKRWEMTAFGAALSTLIVLITFGFTRLAKNNESSPNDDNGSKTIKPAFAVRAEHIIDEKLPWFWSVPNSTVACPAPIAIYLDVTNLQPIPSVIDKLQVEMRSHSGAWVPLPRLNTLDPIIYAGPKMEMMLRVETQFLDRLLQSHNLASHETVRGWALFDRPIEESVFAIRVKMSDFAGISYTSDAFIPERGNVQDVSIKLKAPPLDLSHYKVSDCGEATEK